MDDLRHLMSAYFHQDWWEEYAGSWEEAVDDYVRREPGRVVGLGADIRSVLDARLPEPEVARTLEDLGNFRDPGTASDAYTSWLRAILERLSTPASLGA